MKVHFLALGENSGNRPIGVDLRVLPFLIVRQDVVQGSQHRRIMNSDNVMIQITAVHDRDGQETVWI